MQANWFPGLKAHPRVILGHAPTPLDTLDNLGADLGITLWAKRDDCNGLAFGGNKVRQLEYYLGPGREQGADTVLITGALQSNFVRLTAAAACRLGWRAEVQLEDRVPKTDPVYRSSGNILLDHLFGARIHTFCRRGGRESRRRQPGRDRRTPAWGRPQAICHSSGDRPSADRWPGLRRRGSGGLVATARDQ